MNQQQLDLVRQVKYAIRQGYSFPGGYRLVVTNGYDTLCGDCARNEFRELVAAIRDHCLVGVTTHWEGAPIHCDGCDAVIESEYGE